MRYKRLLLGVALVFVAVAKAQTDGKKTEVKLGSDEQKLLDWTNAERKKADAPPLVANALLCRVAREHSQNMARQEKLAHVLDEKTPFDRLDDAKYQYQAGAENVAMTGDPKPNVAEIFKLWMESELHKKNILNPKYTEIGIGLGKNDKGEVYYTQVFAKPLKLE